MSRMKQKKSLRQRLIRAFLVTSIIPLILLTFLSYFNTTNLLRTNIDTLIENNLRQTESSLLIWLEAYEDLLYQLYTDDEIVTLVDNINDNEDVALSINQMRRTMRAIQDSKDFIESITIITDSGRIISTDLITQDTTINSWMGSFSMSKEQLYGSITSDNFTHYYPTEFAITFANKNHYLFHIAHRIIDYKDIVKQNGVVVISINERLLNQVCSGGTDTFDYTKGFNFLVDEWGHVISFFDEEELTKEITTMGQPIQQRKEDYQEYVEGLSEYTNKNTEIHIRSIDDLGWDIVNVSEQSHVFERLEAQRRLFVIVFIGAILALAIIIFSLMTSLTKSIDLVVKRIRDTDNGAMAATVPIDDKMPIEIELIANAYNTTVEELSSAVDKEKKALEKQKDAEIMALEAQINPHFLYNTLDTINWMAIDKDEYEISNAIGALAVILRYAIDKSNHIVTVKEEVEWLKKYIFLQQTRLKNAFHCDVHVEPQVLGMPIHKLLLQPFVENAILHGFDKDGLNHYLLISIEQRESKLKIRIQDNGMGIEARLAEKFSKGDFSFCEYKNHIGIKNAVSRIKMYYGETADVCISSVPAQGTIVEISITLKDGVPDENSNR